MNMVSDYISREELLQTTAHTNSKPSHVPLFIPKSEAYFWTREWQQGEKEAQEEIDAGLCQRFETTEDALKWLNDGEPVD